MSGHCPFNKNKKSQKVWVLTGKNPSTPPNLLFYKSVGGGRGRGSTRIYIIRCSREKRALSLYPRVPSLLEFVQGAFHGFFPHSDTVRRRKTVQSVPGIGKIRVPARKNLMKYRAENQGIDMTIPFYQCTPYTQHSVDVHIWYRSTILGPNIFWGGPLSCYLSSDVQILWSFLSLYPSRSNN